MPLPVDVVVAKEFAESATATVKLIADVAADDMILDIGPQTAANFAELLKSSKTILWNGPVGVFEFDQFGNGTRSWPRPSPKARPSPSPVAEIPWPLSINMALPTRSPTFLPAAVRSSNSSKAKCCRRLKSWKAGPRPEVCSVDQERECSDGQDTGAVGRRGIAGRLRE